MSVKHKSPVSFPGKKYHKINIFGDAWRYASASEEEMNKLDPECKHVLEGLTFTDHKIIYINKDYIKPNVITHELVHAYKIYCCIDSTELHSDQLEEIFCDLVANNLTKLVKDTKVIYGKLRK